MKKSGLFNSLLITAALSLFLAAPIGSVYAASTEGGETSDTTTGAETPDAPVTGVGDTTAPPSTDTPPSTDDPIVQPEPEPAENTVFLTHSTPLRAGEEVTFTFSCSGEDVRALRGSISYDKNLLTFQSSSVIDTSWILSVSLEGENKLNYVGMPIEADGASGVTHLFSLTFTLSADAVTGNPIPFTVSDAAALKGTTELTFTGGPVTFLVDRPISDDAFLTALTVEDGTLSPAFASEITEYSLQVPYQCESLVLAATPSSYATVAISDTTLTIGENTVKITVTAESGKQQTYTLTVTRNSDPNYVPSSDSLLTGLTLSDGMLFPAFTPSVTQYTVYMVNDGEITLTPTPALLGIAEPVTLADTEGAACTLTSFAEDGTSTIYSFTVLRVQPPEQLAATNSNSASAKDGKSMQTELFIALLAVVAVSLFFVGFGVSQLTHRKKKASLPTAPIEDADTDENIPEAVTEPTDSTEPSEPNKATEPSEPTGSDDAPLSSEPDQQDSETSESPSDEPNASNGKKRNRKNKKKHH